MLYVWLFLIFFIGNAVAADLPGKWMGPKGGVMVCGEKDCKIAEGKASGFVILKDIEVKDGKGKAKMHIKDQWVDMTIEISDKELAFTGPGGGKFSWKRAE